MTADRLSVGDRLPALTLSGDDRAPVRLRDPARGSPVILLPPDSPAEAFVSYAESLAAAGDRLRDWYGRPLLVIGEGDGSPLRPPHLPVLADREGALRFRCGAGGEIGALVVADRWGQIYLLAATDRADELPTIDALEEWVKYLATQCPECGVIDEPGHGEWTVRAE